MLVKNGLQVLFFKVHIKKVIKVILLKIEDKKIKLSMSIIYFSLIKFFYYI